ERPSLLPLKRMKPPRLFLLFAAFAGAAAFAQEAPTPKPASPPPPAEGAEPAPGDSPSSPAPTKAPAAPATPEKKPAAVSTLLPEEIEGFDSYPADLQKIIRHALTLTTQNLRYQFGS